ncbi:hypothetical protein Trydic_g15530 [Trypoxylus dichotomus]
MSASCGICSKELVSEKEIACDLCRKVMHSVCAGLSIAEMQCLKSRDRKVSFYCAVCSDFEQQLHNLTSLVHDLQNEIKELKKKTASGMDMDIFDREAVIQEVMDREWRTESIMFFNVPEETSGDKNCQVADDVVTCKNILSTLTGPIRPIRLGRYDPSKSNRKRPIKITPRSNGQVNRAIRNYKHLKCSTVFKLVNVSKDKTPQQIVLYRRVREELHARKSTGESDIYIKYIRDIPKIVKSRPLN